ncbi:MAG: TraR/DksA C4-type zinc finger protein [Deltaproteobacteria bacterium]|nr:TraR/DksA C4-type zinc finger protein [Deltaproteobacteria bacterium]
MISAEEIKLVKDYLLKRRGELVEEREHVQDSWEALHEPEVEIEERAQKESLSKGLNFLDELELAEVEAIDRALGRVESGEYGLCETCGVEIPAKRLLAVPWTTQCARCRRAEEARGRPEISPPGAVSAQLGSEYAGLSDEALADAVYDELSTDGRVSLDELTITARKGVLHLTGALPSEEEHQVLLEIVEDVMGLSDLVDTLRIDPVAWERENRTPGKKKTGSLVDVVAEGRPLEKQDYEDDVVDAIHEGRSISPADRLIRESEPGEE